MATLPRIPSQTALPFHSIDHHQVNDLLTLQRAAQKISSILDLNQLIDKIVNDVAHSFGCVEASILVHDEERGELVLSGMHGCAECELCKGHRYKIGKDGMVGYVATSGQMRYAPDVRLDPYYVACDAPALSAVAIPLFVEQRLVGVFTASHPESDAFPPEQLRMLQALSSHIAVAVHNARQFGREREQREQMTREVQEARTIQQALLPKSSPYIPGFAVSGMSVPAGAVGGDWYDFIPLKNGCWGLVLADVSGKGTAAALLMSATRGMLRSLAENDCSPGEVMTRLNKLMIEDFPAGRFVTMIYAVLDPHQCKLTFASAGHLPPLLVTDEGARCVSTEAGIPLGIGPGRFSETEVQLPLNARLILYSDGITEAENAAGEEYEIGRLEKAVLSANASPQSILDDVRKFANGNGLRDDATVIFLSCMGAMRKDLDQAA
jgi:sigma-B regulation protein RsbU (phosphoserine phosphatase)